MRIRDAGGQDLGLIEALLTEAYREYECLLPEHVWKSWMESMRDSLHSGKGELIVCELEGRIVAFVHFFPDATQSKLDSWPEGSASLRMLCVAPECRRNGYGILLIKECIRRAADTKGSAVYLQTGRTMTAAQGLYMQLGFKPDPRYDEYPFGPEDHTIAYRYDLTPVA